MDDLDARLRLDRRGIPVRPAHDRAIQFDRNPVSLNSEHFQQTRDRRAPGDAPRLAIQPDLDANRRGFAAAFHFRAHAAIPRRGSPFHGHYYTEVRATPRERYRGNHSRPALAAGPRARMGLSAAGMPVEFRSVVVQQPDRRLQLDFSIEDGVFAGIIGSQGSGRRTLLRLASGDAKPDSGELRIPARTILAAATLHSSSTAEIRAELDAILAQRPRLLLIGPSADLLDEEHRQYLVAELHRRQRQGAIILLATNDLSLVEQHCDEAVLLDLGRVAAHGEARRVAAAYRKRVFERLRASAAPAAVAPAARHGDGRAVLRSIRILGREGGETSLVESGELITVSVGIRFKGDVDDPVCGILIRSRVGITVYGTNTGQENLHFGPCRDGDEVEVGYRFDCSLCPGEYTITVASHDPDGTAHEWLEEAVLFTVTDTRYTTGVANLRAEVNVRRLTGAVPK